MNTDTVRNNSNAQSSTRAFLPRSRGFHPGAPRQAPAVVTITFSIRWRNEPGHTVYRLCLSVGEEPASSDKGHRKLNQGRPAYAGLTRGNQAVYEAKEKENGEDYKFSDLMQTDRG